LPQVSVILAAYNVARWLPEFLSSLDRQTGGLRGFELIFVDDGSTDDTATAIDDWIRRSGADARLIRQANAGAGAARNTGLAHARGEWLTFWDPDDILAPTYTAEIRTFLDSPLAAQVDLVVGRIVWLNESTGRRQNHPLNYRFAAGDRIVDLETQPEMIHLATNTGFYRRSVLRQHKLEFDNRVVPTFEDGHLTGRYLGKFDRPRIALCGGAHYLYRRRADQSSLVQTGWSRPAKYTDQPRHGWLDLLQKVRADRGRVPHWTQHVVLYELQWYFRFETAIPNQTAWVPAGLAEEFHTTLAEVAALLDDDYIQTFANTQGGFTLDMAAALLHGIKGTARHPQQVTVDRIDVPRRLAQWRYYYGTRAPIEVFHVNGHRVRPIHAKTRRIQFLGRVLAHERIVWLPATDTVALSLDGVPCRVEIGPVGNEHYEATPLRMWQELADQAPPRDSATTIPPAAGRHRRRLEHAIGELRRRAPRARRTAQRIAADRVTKELAATPPVRKLYRDAWVVMDRDTAAQDNAEHFYRYLRAEHPELNAWFALNRDSPDWERLAAEGFRLLEHGSPRHKMALLNARHLISSHADGYVVNPLNRKRFGNPRWRYTFLQHGVIKDDLSTWLNGKPIDLMLTTTRDEHESIVGDGSRYRYTTLEMARTGLPRHDRLWRLGAAEPPNGRRTLLVMPTWRMNLLGERTSGGNARARISGFWDSDFMQSWRAVLESDRLRKAVDAHGCRIVLVLHPNMEEYQSESPLPVEIAVHRFSDIDIQELLVSAVAMVTDFSSLAFDAAYIDRPVVYYHFDAEEFFASHVYTRSTWSYTGDGFGPVCGDVDSALDAIVALLENGGIPEPEYARRMAQTFDLRDGGCCERTYRRIRALESPPPAAEVYTPIDPDTR